MPRRFLLHIVLLLALVLAGCGAKTAASSPVSPQVPSPGSPKDAPSGTPVAGSPAVRVGATALATPLVTPLVTPHFHLKLIASGLARPVYVVSPPGDTHRQFIVEQRGKILVRKNGVLLARPFLNITNLLSTGNEEGLLSLAFDPHYATNRRFYVFYTDRAGDIRVVRYLTSVANPDLANASSAKVIFAAPHHAYTNHNGGQLAFGPDGLLYIGIGDGGSEGDPNLYGQNLHVPYAKIWRENVLTLHKQIYAYGLRNPWRFSFDPTTGALWIGDVGQNRWEEIDYLKAGAAPGTNFGWSYYEGDHVYRVQPIDRRRLVFPVYEYSHAQGCAVIGGYVYRGSAIPALRGWYLFGDLCSGRLWLMHGPKGPVRLAAASGRVTNITSFGQDASGELYLTSLSGRVYKLVP